MHPTDEIQAETLDPKDWEDFRHLTHAIVDDMVDYLRTVRDRPAWQTPSPEARAPSISPFP